MDDKNIYFDYQSTTPMDRRVLDAMMPTMTSEFGNPGSKTHAFGWNAEKMVEVARQQTADVIGANAKDIIFTSGATESNNLAIKGVARFNSDEKNHIITTQIEHKCVLESCKYLNFKEKFDVTYLGVDKDGLINLDELKDAITDKTALVSVMSVNNEIGVIQDLKSIGKICREKGIYFHTDCAQAFGKIPLDVDEMNIDLMSISGHKIYGPKGIGALYVRRNPRVRIEPILHGGGQERGLRSGTAPVFLIVGMGVAAELAKKEMEDDAVKIKKIAKRIIDEFTSIKMVYLNGSDKHRWFGCLNFTFSGIEGESLIMGLKNIAVSSGSACTSANLEPSYVIKAIGVGDDLAHSSVRIGLGRFTTEDEASYLIQKVKKIVEHLRNMSPLWEMMENGVDLNTIKWIN
jgi:cysteine desulfurase